MVFPMDARIVLIKKLIERIKVLEKAVPPLATLPAAAPVAAPAPAGAPAAVQPQQTPGQGQCQKCKKNKFTGGCEAYKHIPPKFLTGIEKCKYFSPKDEMAPAAPVAAPAPAPVLPAAPATMEAALVENSVGEILVPSQDDHKLPLPPGYNPDTPGKGQCFRCKKNKLNGACAAFATIPGEYLSGLKKCPAFTNKDPLLKNPLQELNRPVKKPKQSA
jgi:hypothetical protein